MCCSVGLIRPSGQFTSLTQSICQSSQHIFWNTGKSYLSKFDNTYYDSSVWSAFDSGSLVQLLLYINLFTLSLLPTLSPPSLLLFFTLPHFFTLPFSISSSPLNPSSVHQSPGLYEFISPLQACEHTTGQNRQWRLQRDLVTHFRTLIHCITSDQIYTKFIPTLYKLIAGQVSADLENIIYSYKYAIICVE